MSLCTCEPLCAEGHSPPLLGLPRAGGHPQPEEGQWRAQPRRKPKSWNRVARLLASLRDPKDKRVTLLSDAKGFTYLSTATSWFGGPGHARWHQAPCIASILVGQLLPFSRMAKVNHFKGSIDGRVNSESWNPTPRAWESGLLEVPSHSPRAFTPPAPEVLIDSPSDFYQPKEERGPRAHGPESKHPAPPGGDHNNTKLGVLKPWVENIWPCPIQYGGEQKGETQGTFGKRTVWEIRGQGELTFSHCPLEKDMPWEGTRLVYSHTSSRLHLMAKRSTHSFIHSFNLLR